MRIRALVRLTGFLIALTGSGAQAAVYEAPVENNDLIGDITTIHSQYEDTFVDIGRRHDLGYRELNLANPKVDPWLPGQGTRIVLPTRYILPNAPRKGIVVNLVEMRVYYYPPADSRYAGKVITYPIGIGREGWGTPLGRTTIVRTTAHPDWHPPKSIRIEHKKAGDPLPAVVPAGPDNPLGQYALYLGFNSYLMHGTNKPAGIGLRVSHGCLRLLPEDIAALYSMVKPGTPVTIVNEPYKTGWENGRLYLEAHPPDADGQERVRSYTPLVEEIIAATKQLPDYPVNWERAQTAARQARGVPVPIGPKRNRAKARVVTSP